VNAAIEAIISKAPRILSERGIGIRFAGLHAV
jgi:hypothetical protein